MRSLSILAVVLWVIPSAIHAAPPGPQSQPPRAYRPDVDRCIARLGPRARVELAAAHVRRTRRVSMEESSRIASSGTLEVQADQARQELADRLDEEYRKEYREQQSRPLFVPSSREIRSGLTALRWPFLVGGIAGVLADVGVLAVAGGLLGIGGSFLIGGAIATMLYTLLSGFGVIDGGEGAGPAFLPGLEALDPAGGNWLDPAGPRKGSARDDGPFGDLKVAQ